MHPLWVTVLENLLPFLGSLLSRIVYLADPCTRTSFYCENHQLFLSLLLISKAIWETTSHLSRTRNFPKTGERHCESLMDVKMHTGEIKGSVLVGMRRVASAKLLNQHWHGGGVQGKRVEEHDTGRERSAVSFSIKNSGL